jgi:thiamine biosynthesis lipoprotein
VRTGGAFDVTVGPLSRLWRRARVTGEPPDPAAVAAAKALVGYQHVELPSPGTARLTMAGMLLDLGGIAKGYAADQALAALRVHGASRALVAIGGDVAVGDAPPGKDGWIVAVAPLGPAAGGDVAPLTLRHSAVSTSGDAEQHFERNGTRYSHILTPRTGHSLDGRRGVTVVASDGLTADGLATAVSVLGRERGLALIDDTPGAAALILESSPGGIRAHQSVRW